ncbi:unnamed protein product [Merluccius merluccius]
MLRLTGPCDSHAKPSHAANAKVHPGEDTPETKEDDGSQPDDTQWGGVERTELTVPRATSESRKSQREGLKTGPTSGGRRP